MENLFVYILQVNLLIGLLFIGYYFLLRKLTFFKLNRAYFLAGMVYAFIYPFIDFNGIQKATHVPALTVSTTSLLFLPTASSPTGVSLLTILFYTLGIGGGILFTLLIFRLCAIYRIHRDSKVAQWKHYFYREVGFPISPFTFFKQIYVHRAQHSKRDLTALFQHEAIHARGLHSIDIISVEILMMLCWYNPFVWFLRKAIRQNLEYLTDQRVLENGFDPQEYQFALVHVGHKRKKHPFLGNTFNFQPLKNRIMMMNRKSSRNVQLGKYVFLLPFFLLVGAGLTLSEAQSKISNITNTIRQTSLNGSTGVQEQEKPLVFINGKEVDYTILNAISPDKIESIDVLKDKSAIEKYGDRAKYGVIEVTLKKHGKSALTPIVVKGTSVKNHSKDKNSEVVVTGFSTEALEGKQPIYVVDGKRMAASEAKKIVPNRIESINILKDSEQMIQRYGEEAKNGVILIGLKKK